MMLTTTAIPTNLSLATGIPAFILVPFIMVIAIVSVVGIMWLYKKLDKK